MISKLLICTLAANAKYLRNYNNDIDSRFDDPLAESRSVVYRGLSNQQLVRKFSSSSISVEIMMKTNRSADEATSIGKQSLWRPINYHQNCKTITVSQEGEFSAESFQTSIDGSTMQVSLVAIGIAGGVKDGQVTLHSHNTLVQQQFNNNINRFSLLLLYFWWLFFYTSRWMS